MQATPSPTVASGDFFRGDLIIMIIMIMETVLSNRFWLELEEKEGLSNDVASLSVIKPCIEFGNLDMQIT